MAYWYEQYVDLLEKIEVPEIIINDAKTPSGRVHVGSVRGVIIHDAIAKAARARGINARFIYDIDDYDAMDGLPSDSNDDLKAHMGKPLFQVPSPVAGFASMADYYADEFIAVLKALGAEFDLIKASNFYPQGLMNEAIERILNSTPEIRKIYFEVSKSKRPDNWYPFQVICENCGKIGTTLVTDFDGKEVTYTCEPKAVTWAQGCGYQGKISPFDGNGKLPWKVEWPSKWSIFGIHLEGAGKDHCTKGGSHDVAEACFKRVFGGKVPINVPYEFFLVSGSKMSSSKGIGSSSQAISDFLPSDMLRFLMMKTQPKKTVNFSTDLEYMTKLFNEYDQQIQKKSTAPEDRLFLELCSAKSEINTEVLPAFQLLVALLQLPHYDVEAQFLDQCSKSQTFQIAFQRRLQAARYWLAHFAQESERIEIQTTLPDSIQALNALEASFFTRLVDLVQEAPSDITEEGYQTLIFDAARLTPIAPKRGFELFYQAVLNRLSGPKGGSLIAYLGRDYIKRLMGDVQWDSREASKLALESEEDFVQWIQALAFGLKHIETQNEFAKDEYELVLKTEEGKCYRRFVRLSSLETVQNLIT